jgi:hypothetical protein
VKAQRLLILLLILVSLIPVYYLNRWFQQFVQPRRSFLRFLLYMILGLGFAFLYTYLLTFVIFHLFKFK